MVSRLRHILLTFFFFKLLIGWAAPSHVFRHYTSADGLPSNSIRDIIQDEKGFVWVATDGGLSRFDGSTFRNFNPNESDVNVSSDPFVSNMVIRRHGLWIATIDGLLCYNDSLERLQRPDLTYGKDCPKITGFITDMVVDHKDCIWVSTANGGIFNISPANKVQLVKTPSGVSRFNSLFVDRRGEIWALSSSKNSGLFKYDADSKSFKRFEIKVEDKDFNLKTNAICEDESNHLWIGQADGSLICVDPFAGSCQLIKIGDSSHIRNIHSINMIGDGNLFIGNDYGVAVYNLAEKNATYLQRDELRPSSLSGQFVYPVVSDMEGGVWIGTFYAGLNYLPPDIKHFESYSKSRFVNSVSGYIISSFCEDSYGNIYIGSEDGGVSRYDRATDSHTSILPSSNVQSLCVNGDELWVGTFNGGIKIFDCKTGNLWREMSGVKTSDGGFINSCISIFSDRQGDIWIGSENFAFRYDREADIFRKEKTLEAWTTDIKQDIAGNIWFSTSGSGLFCYSKHDNKWRQYRYEAQKPGSIICDHVSGVDFDSNGLMWVATDNGLACFDNKTDSFTPVNIPGVGNSILFAKSCGEDIWVGSGRGLVRYNPKSKAYSFFGTADGLADNQVTLNSIFQDSSGLFYVGTINGYTRFRPEHVGSNEVIPPVVFTSLDVAGRHVDIGDSRLHVGLNHMDCLNLGPDDNSFSVSFAALSFMNPENNSYLYKLEGFDKDWMPADDSRRASYTNLAPGDYVLHVKASNNDKLWNEAGISLPIHIAPHWYNTWVARLVYFLIIVGLIGAVFLLLSRRNKRLHAEELDRVNTAKEIEVYQAKMNFFTTVAHEIRTPVSLIMGPLESIMKDRQKFSESQNDEFDIIHRNTRRLLFLVNQLLDFRKVESLAVDAKFLPADIPSLVKSVTDRFKPSLSQLGIELDLNLPQESFKADVDAEAVTKLVSNLLNNARKFTKSLITLTCKVNSDGQSFSIEVADDGNGISESDMKRIFEPFVQLKSNESRAGTAGTGLGLSIVSHVVAAHSGKIDVRSKPGEGACFVVSLPLRQEAVASLADIVNDDDITSQMVAAEKTPDISTPVERPVMLVTDDNPDLLKFLSNYFSEKFSVVTALDAEEALRQLAGFKVDLVVSDWMMPGMSGVDFCRKLRENRDYSHIPFILLTAKADESSKIEGLNCGADAYIEKPFSIDYLAARISNLLDLRSLLKQKFSSVPLEPIGVLATNPVDNGFLSQLTSIVEANFSNPELSVDFLCRKLGISRSGLYAKVKSLTDSTPNELIQITRLKKAAQLISEHRYRINEICYMVGFSNPSYFSKCFQRQFGMKPGEFKG